MSKTVLLMAEIQCWPLWIYNKDYMRSIINVNPQEYVDDNKLCNNIIEWSDSYTESIDLKDPLCSLSQISIEKEIIHDIHGLLLPKALSQKLSDDTVVEYYSIIFDKRYSDLNLLNNNLANKFITLRDYFKINLGQPCRL